MKQQYSSCPPLARVALLLLLFLVVVSFHSATAARLLPTTPLVQQADAKMVETGGDGGGDGLAEVMGGEMEACEDGNEECLQRRLLHDAHLDYIYTQHHQKP